MTEILTVISERVDDIPLLLAQSERMGLQSLLNEHFPAHGNWQGLGLGGVGTIWLSHILSQADHRLNHVQPWAEKRLETLACCIGQPVRGLDFSDDRLGDVLHALSNNAHWDAFESGLNRRLLRVYDLQPELVRLDSTTASGYWSVTSDGLFQLGHSKDRRPDLPQVKVMMATLDPLGLPAVTDVVAGQQADDPLYVPAIRRVRESLGRRGLLYVGDCKMGALATRAFIQVGKDFYLCPLSKKQVPQDLLDTYLAPIWAGKQSLIPIYRTQAESKPELIAEGYERRVVLTAEVEGQTVTWTERRLVIRSLKQAEAAERGLRNRLAQAQATLIALNDRGRGKKHYQDAESLRQAAEAIVKKYRVQGLLQLGYLTQRRERPVRRYRERPATVRIEQDVQVIVVVDQAALDQEIRQLGWRVYATNQPAAQLPMAQAILAYRDEYIIEHGFGRLKGQPLSLTPMYLQRDDHATGLIRLLSIGLRLLTLTEFVARRRLAEKQASLPGLYAGNPKRTTTRPTTERLLEAFQEITLTIIQQPDRSFRHLTPLSNVQLRILDLLGLSPIIYNRLCTDSVNPP
jgi:transposase